MIRHRHASLGRYLGEVHLGYGLPRNAIPAITDSRFVGVSLDRDDVPSIVWSRIVKPTEAPSAGP